MLNETEANLIDIDDMPTFSIDTPREVLHPSASVRAGGSKEMVSVTLASRIAIPSAGASAGSNGRNRARSVSKRGGDIICYARIRDI